MASAVPLIPANQPDYGGNQVGLDQALANFRASVQQYSLTNALSRANDQVRGIQQSQLKEQEKMAALNDVARSLTFSMASSGAPAAHIEQAVGIVRPKPIQTADEAILRGSLANDQQLVQRGLQADYMSAANKLALLEGKTNKRPLLSGEIDKIQGFDNSNMQLSAMMKQVEEDPSLVGPVAGRIPGRAVISPEFAAFKQQAEQFFNAYRQQITGAGASTQELRMLRAATPTVADKPDVFLAKAKSALKIGQQVKAKYLGNLAKAGRDVGEFSVQEQEQTAEKASQGGAPAWNAFIKK